MVFHTGTFTAILEEFHSHQVFFQQKFLKKNSTVFLEDSIHTVILEYFNIKE